MPHQHRPAVPLRFRWMRARRYLADLIGIELTPTHHAEKLLSGAAGFLAMLVVLSISNLSTGHAGLPYVVASMGASAVLVFAVPHGALSQPWPVLGGHGVSALAGVACHMLFGDGLLAAAGAVALAILGMYYLRCIHPPGGATALTAVIGGPGIYSLGFAYVLTPVLLNAAVLVAMGLAINNCFHSRRYPVFLRPALRPKPATGVPFRREDLAFALRAHGSFIDVEESDLERLFDLAQQHARGARVDPHRVQPGLFFSNDLHDALWEVRQIVDMSGPGADDQVIYTVVDGPRRRVSGILTKREFAAWSRYQVHRVGTAWRPGPDPATPEDLPK